MLEAQLRGYGASSGPSRRPPANLAAPGATLAETSRAPGQHDITTLIGDSALLRQGLEKILPARGQVKDPALKQSFYIMVAERLHAVGRGIGAESDKGIGHGASFINQVLQNRGVEALMRFLHRERPPGIRFIVHVDVRTRTVGHGGETQMLESITYRVRAVEEMPDGSFRPVRDMFEGTITQPKDIKAATRPRGRGDIQGIGVEVEPSFGALAEHFGL